YPINDDVAAAHGLQVRDVDAVETTNYPISLVVLPRRQLQVVLGYDADLFDAATIERMAGHLGHVLEVVAADPTLPLGRIDILTGQERQQVLEAWNDTACAVAAASLPELFEAQVARTPDAPAVLFADPHLSYSEL